jgi:sulfite dehydrogenase (cytochrome) subunit B
MRHRCITGAAVAVAVMLAAPVLAADEGNVQLKEGPGKDLTSGRCAICHSLEYIPSNAPAMDRAAWQKTVQKMRERFGAPISDEEARSILDYLSATYAGKS